MIEIKRDKNKTINNFLMRSLKIKIKVITYKKLIIIIQMKKIRLIINFTFNFFLILLKNN